MLLPIALIARFVPEFPIALLRTLLLVPMMFTLLPTFTLLSRPNMFIAFGVT